MVTAGVDIGGTNLKGGLVGREGQILKHQTEATPTDLDSLVDAIDSLLEDLAREAPFEAVGLGIPGLRSSATRRIESSPNMPFLDGVNLEARIADRIRKPVVGRNDAEMYAWGEFSLGAGYGAQHMVCLTLGTGVGSGLVANGRLYSGSNGYAPEAGHLIVQEDGLRCPCGGRGCLETLVSATGIVALARRLFAESPAVTCPESLTAQGLHRMALEGHRRAERVFQQAGLFLGIACTDLIHLLNPEVIVIGGGVSLAGPFLLEPAIAESRARTLRPAFEACRIVPARLGSEAGVVGAALWARDANL